MKSKLASLLLAIVLCWIASVKLDRKPVVQMVAAPLPALTITNAPSDECAPNEKAIESAYETSFRSIAEARSKDIDDWLVSRSIQDIKDGNLEAYLLAEKSYKWDKKWRPAVIAGRERWCWIDNKPVFKPEPIEATVTNWTLQAIAFTNATVFDPGQLIHRVETNTLSFYSESKELLTITNVVFFTLGRQHQDSQNDWEGFRLTLVPESEWPKIKQWYSSNSTEVATTNRF